MDLQPQPPQPDFKELAQCFQHAAREISLLPNIPAFNQGEIIIASLQQITQAIGDLRNEVRDLRNEVREMGVRFDASETNSIARLHNSAINRLDVPLYPLRDRRNNPVDGFPENGRALMQISGQDFTTVLQAFGQVIDGNVTAKRQRFRRYIGILTEI